MIGLADSISFPLRRAFSSRVVLYMFSIDSMAVERTYA
jgi:hypothetical protein